MASESISAQHLKFASYPVKFQIGIVPEPIYDHLTDHDYLSKRPCQKKIERTIRITDLKAVFNCTTCGFLTMNREALNKHNCLKNLNQNLQKNTTKLPNGYEKCPKCSFSSKNKSNLKLHAETHLKKISKNNLDQYVCPKCNYTTKREKSLKVHMHIHSRGSPYKCSECGFCGENLKELIRHFNEVKDLCCDCGYTTHVKNQMVAHIRCHTGEKPFSCGICQFATADRGSLSKHMKRHNI